MAYAMRNMYLEPEIADDDTCNDYPETSQLIAPIPRCCMTKGHKGNHIGAKGGTTVEWRWYSGAGNFRALEYLNIHVPGLLNHTHNWY